MRALAAIGALFLGWAQLIAAMIVAGIDRVISPKQVRLVEQDDGGFLLHAASADKIGALPVGLTEGETPSEAAAASLRGSRVEIRLAPRRFLFQPLELPAQAADFLDGIVRSQIDRLSPWTAATAIFGCTAPTLLNPSRIAVVVAIAPRSGAMEFVQRALTFQPASVTIVTAESAQAAPIKVFEQKARTFLDVPRLGKALVLLLAVAGAGALTASTAAWLLTNQLAEQKQEATRQIDQIRSLMRRGANSPDKAALQTLERRKYETAAATLVLESLTQVMPDHTYITEFHFDSNKLQVVGVSRDAPSLIRLIEQSPSFSRATFFAPTTRSAGDPGERFHIEVSLGRRGDSKQ
ncbi:general secretion pathway protein L [Rhodopseudomonas rhenobacensis]|uniref:General secretion pathway protein L n=1 Tax=Rhodopseudomonas rhenobacensis TaxID=87461 RepID=A0A7W7Z6T8_9BRAD|nr:PilN domain-containing protein [Rhodopseudomonas rhenobacensis]MBB5048567.1 general secretion pathway protein L [Rhodopseudomonas rhenobacensis]